MIVDFCSEGKVYREGMTCSCDFTKSGRPTLCWEFKSGDSIVIWQNEMYMPEEYKMDPQDELAFACYLGSPQKFDGHINIMFRENDNECCGFNVFTEFKGWRYIKILFSQMNGTPCTEINNLKITAFGEGVLYFDEMLTNYIDGRHVSPSYQLPYLKGSNYIDERYVPVGCRPGDLAQGITINRSLKTKFQPIDFDDDIIEKRIYQYVLDEFGDVADEDKIKEEYQSLNIIESDTGWYIGTRIEEAFLTRMWKNTPWENNKFTSLRKCSDLACALGAAYIKTRDVWYRNAYITLIKYLIQGGVYEGSIVSSRHAIDYSLRPLFRSFVLMKNELKYFNLSDEVRRLCQWFCDMEKLGVYEGQEHWYSTADDFNNMTIGFIIVALFAEDKKERSKWLFALKDWLDRNMQYAPGLLGIYKVDGSIFHHCGHYLGYGIPAMAGVTPVLWALSGTPYAVSRESWNNTKNVLLKMRFSCASGDNHEIPISFSGRNRAGVWGLDPIPFKYFALAATNYDDVPIEDNPSGNIAMNMACAMLHRRNGQLVIMKGFSKYLWGNESYDGCNVYGRYSSYGNVEILGNTLIESGFRHDGFDFRRFSGTTAIIPPWSEFKQDICHVDTYSGYEEMLISDQAFAGGVSDGENGMFSMILTEHPKYNGTHYAIKSGFFVDDFILLIGSNIRNISPYPTETILFQNYTGGESIKDDLIDILGNVYYVNEEQEICIKTELQKSESSTGSGLTEGVFKRASILHGISPTDARYEYSIGLKGARRRDYKIIQQNEIAHIVEIEGIVFMAVYKPEAFCGYEEIISVDIPVLIMINRKGLISICNPDLGLYEYDETQYDKNGKRIEVSIYSRSWIGNEIAVKKCTLKTRKETYSLELLGGITHTL